MARARGKKIRIIPQGREMLNFHPRFRKVLTGPTTQMTLAYYLDNL
jgi:hypothetical protein